MILPINTHGLTVLCGGNAEPVTDFSTGQPKLDAATNHPLYAVPLIMLMSTGPEVIAVKVAGMPNGLAIGGAVQVSDLVATTWAMGDRAGVAFRAASITASTTKSAPSPARAAGDTERSGS